MNMYQGMQYLSAVDYTDPTRANMRLRARSYGSHPAKHDLDPEHYTDDRAMRHGRERVHFSSVFSDGRVVLFKEFPMQSAIQF